MIWFWSEWHVFYFALFDTTTKKEYRWINLSNVLLSLSCVMMWLFIVVWRHENEKLMTEYFNAANRPTLSEFEQCRYHFAVQMRWKSVLVYIIDRKINNWKIGNFVVLSEMKVYIIAFSGWMIRWNALIETALNLSDHHWIKIIEINNEFDLSSQSSIFCWLCFWQKLYKQIEELKKSQLG